MSKNPLMDSAEAIRGILERPIVAGFPWFVVPGLLQIRHQLGCSGDFDAAMKEWDRFIAKAGPAIEEKLRTKVSRHEK